MAALERAVALAEVDRPALAVAEHLELDVARFGQVFLDIDGVVAERRLRLGLSLRHQARERGGVGHDLHAAPAAAARCLDEDRVADRLGDLNALRRARHRAVGARHQRQADRRGGALRLDFVAHRPDLLGIGADPDDVVLLDDVGEARVLAQEAIARVDRVGLGDLGGRDDVRDVEVAVGGRRRPDADRLVGEPDVHRVGVGGRMDRDRPDPHVVRRAVDAQRDLAAVGDQDLLDHSMTISGSSYSTGCSLVTRMRATVPAFGAVIGFITFIASMMSSVAPAFTVLPTAT